MTDNILLIEQDNSLRTNLTQHLRQEGFAVFETDHESGALDHLSNTTIDLTILCLESLKLEGITMLRKIRQRYPHVNIISINSAERFDLSIECMRLGAYDDFLIPFDLDALMISVRGAFKKRPPMKAKSKRKPKPD